MIDPSQIPEELRHRKQWLIWRFEPGKKKPLKVPYWINGKKRYGVQGDANDRAKLTDLDSAIIAAVAGDYTGVGFAFLPDDGLIGIDIDKCIDGDGLVSALAAEVIPAADSYTEYSPSGTGVHIIVAGHTETFKDNGIGLEVFCSSQFFTFTGKHYGGMPFAINQISDAALERLRVLVKGDRTAVDKPKLPPPPNTDMAAKLESALAFIKSDSHDVWIRVGMALFSALGESGFRIWDYWSSKADNYAGSEDCAVRWKSFGSRGTLITEATIFRLAKDAGWRSPKGATPSRDVVPFVRPKPKSAPAESPPPPGEESQSGEESPDLMPAEQGKTEVGLPAGWDDAPPPDADGGEGDEPAEVKEKPKKIYGRDHWDQVKYVLDNFVLIYGEDLVWDVSQRMLMKISSMKTIVQNSDVMKFWGGNARKWVLKKNIVFDPMETPSPAVSGPTATVNLFNGWKMKPRKGTSIKIQTLLHHLCDGDEDLTTWILRWLAYPLRNRGAKMETSIIMHGDEGSGKNFFFEKVIKKIYGEYGYVIGNAQLESQFNDWASMKLFMVADEVVTRSELRHMKGKLKYLVSGETIIVNPKGLPEHSEANHINFVFLSNELQPLALDKTDRRYLVIWTPPALSKEFYIEVAEEIEAGGIEAFYHYLMHEVYMGDFNQHTKPLYTDAKDNLIEKSLTPPERFYRDWSRGFLPLPFITVGVAQLYEAYRIWCERSGEPKYIALCTFSPTIERYAGDAIKKKLIKYDLGHKVKQRLVFLIGDQPEGKGYADWAADASALFENHYQQYRQRSHANVDADP
jgi:hypothetical protein